MAKKTFNSKQVLDRILADDDSASEPDISSSDTDSYESDTGDSDADSDYNYMDSFPTNALPSNTLNNVAGTSNGSRRFVKGVTRYHGGQNFRGKKSKQINKTDNNVENDWETLNGDEDYNPWIKDFEEETGLLDWIIIMENLQLNICFCF
jgi:hypothetical protein